MSEVSLVEVVDVEDEHPVAVHVGAEILGVQVALDPDAARALVGPAVLFLLHVGVEQAGAAPIEGERSCRHLPELLPERVGVGLHQPRESVHQHVHYPCLTLVGGPVLPLEIYVSGHEVPSWVGERLRSNIPEYDATGLSQAPRHVRVIGFVP